MTTKQLIILMSLATVGVMARPQSGGGGKRCGQDGGPQHGGGFIERLDQDGDGKVSSREFDGPGEHFSRFDQNGDGYINEEEAPEGPPPGRQQEGGQEKQRPSKDNQKPREQGGQKGAAPEGFVCRLDRDGDGKVSRSEFDGPEDAFPQLDRNGDGYISEEEAPTGPPPRNRE